MGARPKL
ncbi:bacterial regulatory helix-turn-helix, lysR family protein, partial [Yersinia pestis PY-34]